MTFTRPSSTESQSRHDSVLGAGLVLAAVATAVGAFWMITGPAAAAPESPQTDRHGIPRVAGH